MSVLPALDSYLDRSHEIRTPIVIFLWTLSSDIALGWANNTSLWQVIAAPKELDSKTLAYISSGIIGFILLNSVISPILRGLILAFSVQDSSDKNSNNYTYKELLADAIENNNSVLKSIYDELTTQNNEGIRIKNLLFTSLILLPLDWLCSQNSLIRSHPESSFPLTITIAGIAFIYAFQKDKNEHSDTFVSKYYKDDIRVDKAKKYFEAKEIQS